MSITKTASVARVGDDQYFDILEPSFKEEKLAMSQQNSPIKYLLLDDECQSLESTAWKSDPDNFDEQPGHCPIFDDINIDNFNNHSR